MPLKITSSTNTHVSLEVHADNIFAANAMVFIRMSFAKQDIQKNVVNLPSP